MRVLFELLRIIFIFVLLGGLIWFILGDVYTVNEAAQSFQWIAALGIYVALFVLYRNKLQFSGWYKGRGREKLSKRATITLMSCSAAMLAVPIVLSFLLHG